MCHPVLVSNSVVTLRHEATNPAVGYTVEFLRETQRFSLPNSHLFYLDGEVLGESLASADRVASLLMSVKSEWSAQNCSCEAKNKVSRERSEPEKFPLAGLFGPTPSPSRRDCQKSELTFLSPPTTPSTTTACGRLCLTWTTDPNRNVYPLNSKQELGCTGPYSHPS